MNNMIGLPSINLGAGFLPAVEYEPANSTYGFNKDLDKLQSLGISEVFDVSCKELQGDRGPFVTILVEVLLEGEYYRRTYQWFHIWNCPNGEEMLRGYFSTLTNYRIRRLKRGPMKLFFEAVWFGRDRVPPS